MKLVFFVRFFFFVDEIFLMNFNLIIILFLYFLFIFVWCNEIIHFVERSYLLPDKNRNAKQKTIVAKRTLSPVWNHTFTYEDVSLDELSERALELTIWDHDRLASNEFLGGIRLSLGTGKH